MAAAGSIHLDVTNRAAHDMRCFGFGQGIEFMPKPHWTGRAPTAMMRALDQGGFGFRNRLSVALRWGWAYTTFQRGARLITGADV